MTPLTVSLLHSFAGVLPDSIPTSAVVTFEALGATQQNAEILTERFRTEILAGDQQGVQGGGVNIWKQDGKGRFFPFVGGVFQEARAAGGAPPRRRLSGTAWRVRFLHFAPP